MQGGECEGRTKRAATLGGHLMPVFGSRGFPNLVIDQLLVLAGALPDVEVHALTAGLARAQGDRIVPASRPQHHKFCMLISELNQPTHLQL